MSANGLGLKFLVNLSQLKWFRQSERREKIIGSLSLFMKATIPGTQGSMKMKERNRDRNTEKHCVRFRKEKNEIDKRELIM